MMFGIFKILEMFNKYFKNYLPGKYVLSRLQTMWNMPLFLIQNAENCLIQNSENGKYLN